MYEKSLQELSALGADITTSEIMQQPQMWLKTLDIFKSKRGEIDTFLQNISNRAEERVRVIFTGAGSSQYVGDTIVPYLNKAGDSRRFSFESIGSTDLTAIPEDYLIHEVPTILVSFGRSGNSPESLEAVRVADKYVKQIYHIVITCAEEGALAAGMTGRENGLVLLTPVETNDKGFAMTGSFTCMMVLAALIFDQTAIEQKEVYLKAASAMGSTVIEREEEIHAMLDKKYDRIVYTGSGSLSGLTREAILKVLELTAGKIAVLADSSMGFRHGPKSFVNESTLVFTFLNNDPKVRQYDLDVAEEVAADKIAAGVFAIGQTADRLQSFSGESFMFGGEQVLPEIYLALPAVMVAQTVALLNSVRLENKPDTPSPTGTVNRVVKGVKIYED